MGSLTERMRASHLLKREPAWLLRVGMVACAFGALALLLLARVTAPSAATATTLIGRPAGAFSLPAAQSGVKLPSSTRFAGAAARPTLLVFFYTLCVHCLSEVSAAHDASDTASGGPLDLIFIDTPGENAQITGAYMARLRLDPPVLLDASGAVARDYGVRYAPTIVLVDTRGVIRGVWVGEVSTATLTAGIRHALSG